MLRVPLAPIVAVYPVVLKFSVVFTQLKSLRLEVYWTEPQRHFFNLKCVHCMRMGQSFLLHYRLVRDFPDLIIRSHWICQSA